MRPGSRRTFWILSPLLVAAIIQGPHCAAVATSEGAAASGNARVSPIPELRKVEHRLVRALNNEEQEVARRYANKEVYEALRYVSPLFSLDCYRTPRGRTDGTQYTGRLKYGCSLVDIGSYYYGIGLKKVDGRWKAVDFQELAHGDPG